VSGSLIGRAAHALLERWDDTTAAQALARLPTLDDNLAAPSSAAPIASAAPAAPAAPIAARGTAGRQKPVRPSRIAAARPKPRVSPSRTARAGDSDELAYLAVARGMLLRKLDKDEEAIAAFRVVYERFGAHPLASLARDQASTLLRTLNRAREADALDEQILATAIPGELHRAALWRLGFGAILAGDAPRAARFLRELEWRHGGDPDRHAFSWFERARYWRGRAAELGARSTSDVKAGRKEAEALWQGLIQRYPAGWYALLARSRLGRLVEADTAHSEQGWDESQDDAMATALTLYRLGEERRALTQFEALMDAGQLPGNGRRLLADLYDLAGDTRKADRVLRYAAIPPTMPGDDPDLAYFDWYPLRFEDALGEAAHKNNLPSSLLAGLVSVETRFSADAKSSVGAMGAAQLMPGTGKAIGQKVFGKGFDARSLKDPDVNLAVAARYLSDLMDRFKGHPALAVAAYNAGPAPVRRWLELRGGLELDAFVETIPFEQARRYVMRVLSDAEIYRRLYGLDGRPTPLPLTLDRASGR
jgi:soluble lytic murein transglycosylase